VQDSVDFRAMTADSWAAHSPDDCSMAQWPVYSAVRYLSKAARWKAEQDSADFQVMAGDSWAAHSPGDCSMARRPRVVLAE
jgi:type 1 glutamine amidotransferase